MSARDAVEAIKTRIFELANSLRSCRMDTLQGRFGRHTLRSWRSIVDLDMHTLMQLIPHKERCPKCEGKGNIVIGYAMNRALYADCVLCWGKGRAVPYAVGEQFDPQNFIKRLDLCPRCKKRALTGERTVEKRILFCEEGHGWQLNRLTKRIEDVN